jgi:hypothetical protein
MTQSYNIRGTALAVLFVLAGAAGAAGQTGSVSGSAGAGEEGQASATSAPVAVPAREAEQPSASMNRPQAVPADAQTGRDWVRYRLDERGNPLGMEIAIVRYTGQRSAEGGAQANVEVDLIGAVHIGDEAYYEQLNERFREYDVLLYELVAPRGTVVEPGRAAASDHPVAALQNSFKTLLELDHQLDKIDYKRPNFVHADMSPEEFAAAMQDRNESFVQMYFRLMGAAIAQQSEGVAGAQPNEADIFAALFAQDRPRRLKIILGKQMAEMESLLVGFAGEGGSAIITDRNKIALNVLKEQMAAGKKRIGIFYGAGHLQDMDQRLREEFHLQPTSITWLTAWDLTEKR